LTDAWQHLVRRCSDAALNLLGGRASSSSFVERATQPALGPPWSIATTASNRDGSRYESILKSLDAGVDDLEDDDNETYKSNEYDAAMKEFEAELAHEELSKKKIITQQVLMASKGDQTMTKSPGAAGCAC
jgi:hypothetical protein